MTRAATSDDCFRVLLWQTYGTFVPAIVPGLEIHSAGGVGYASQDAATLAGRVEVRRRIGRALVVVFGGLPRTEQQFVATWGNHQ